MNRKKIFIVSRSFYPSISPRSYRATELAKEFARQGHDVTVFTHIKDFDLNKFSRQHNFIIGDFAKGKWKDLSGNNNILIRILRRVLKYLFMYPDIQLTSLVSKALKEATDYDLLISIAVPYSVHWGVALAIKKNSQLTKVWIADCGDPFLGNKEINRNYPFYFRFVENWFCRQPDFITVPIKEAIEAYPAFCREKIRVIPQGFNFYEAHDLSEKKENPYPVFAYAGLLTSSRDPGQFLEYLYEQKNKRFKFVIFTTSVSRVEPYKIRLGDKLEIRDYIPREQLLNELLQMDFLVNFENIDNIQSPSKLIDYALVRRPILSIKPNDLDEKVVAEFLTGDYSKQLVIKDIEQYNIKNVTEKFLSILNHKTVP